MKLIVLGLAFTAVLFSVPKAQAQLRHEDFLRLSEEDQFEYVEHLKTIIKDMTVASFYFADSEEPQPRDIASSVPYVPAGNIREINLSIAISKQHLDQFNRLIAEKKVNRLKFLKEDALDFATRSVRIHLVSAAAQAKGLPASEKTQVLQRIQVVNESFERSLIENSRLVDPDAAYFADSNLSILRYQLNVPFQKLQPSKTATGNIKPRLPAKKVGSTTIPKSVGSSQTAMASRINPTPTNNSHAAQMVPQVAVKTAPGSLVPPPAPTPKSTEVEASSTTGLCVYAGFIIKRDRCTHEETLPFPLSNFETSKFICEPPNVLCNPLLFGYNSDCQSDDFQECLKTATPVCTQRVKNATEICTEQSKDAKFTKRAVDLIKKNKSAYEQYLKDFKGLCDEKNLPENPRLKYTADKKPRSNYKSLLADVVTTCAIAKNRLDSVTALYQSILNHRPADSSPKGQH